MARRIERVAADHPETARRAARRIRVDYEVLPAFTDPGRVEVLRSVVLPDDPAGNNPAIIAAAMAFVQNAPMLYAFRILLGIAEAGFFPGIMLYLTFWFPRSVRVRLTGLFMIALPASSALGAPIAGAILQYWDGLFGLAGTWCGRQWARTTGPVGAAVLGALYTAAMGGSHPLARKIGPWPSVLVVTAGVAAASEAAEAWGRRRGLPKGD